MGSWELCWASGSPLVGRTSSRLEFMTYWQNTAKIHHCRKYCFLSRSSQVVFYIWKLKLFDEQKLYTTYGKSENLYFFSTTQLSSRLFSVCRWSLCLIMSTLHTSHRISKENTGVRLEDFLLIQLNFFFLPLRRRKVSRSARKLANSRWNIGNRWAICLNFKHIKFDETENKVVNIWWESHEIAAGCRMFSYFRKRTLSSLVILTGHQRQSMPNRLHHLQSFDRRKWKFKVFFTLIFNKIGFSQLSERQKRNF